MDVPLRAWQSMWPVGDGVVSTPHETVLALAVLELVSCLVFGIHLCLQDLQCLSFFSSTKNQHS